MESPGLLKRRLRPTPQGAAISLIAPQQAVAVRWVHAGSETDVTTNCAVAALRPFTLRMGLPPEGAGAVDARAAQLRLVDRERDELIGVLNLQFLRDWTTGGSPSRLYEVVGGTHYCAPRLRRMWDSWMYRRAARTTPSQKMLMTLAAVEQFMVFYSCPRPVYFVSVDGGSESNIFPMDLVGPLPPDRFTLALRNTSPSVETIKKTGQLALGDVPGTASAIAYELGKHHQQRAIDWSTLPFETIRSPRFQLRIPEISLRAREIEILDFQVVGSHTLFLGRICSEQILCTGPQLFHTSGAYQALRTRERRPFRSIKDAP